VTINSHRDTFAGLPIAAVGADVGDPAAVAWFVEDTEDQLDALIETCGDGGPVAIVLGDWESSQVGPPLEDLIERSPRLGNLRALFAGDITFDESEMSWINQGDYGPLLAAFPRLETLWIRGADGLKFPPLTHSSLRELAVQTGGLPPAIVRDILACTLPSLTTLELWLGVENYGGVATPEDLAPLLGGSALPSVTSLGLRNAENADELAAALAGAAVVARLTTLDLSLGILGDAGAEALLTGQPLDHLDVLDLHHHFISGELADRLVSALPGVRVDLSERQDPDTDDMDEGWDGRYTAVSE
jgi:hypothetical protein